MSRLRLAHYRWVPVSRRTLQKSLAAFPSNDYLHGLQFIVATDRVELEADGPQRHDALRSEPRRITLAGNALKSSFPQYG